jgi:ABC-type antimicrobial peptide transport system permease subunit
MFLLKALVLGLTAGTIGCLLGLVTAVTAGPQWVGVSVSPIPSLSILAVCAATGLAVVAAFWPARQAAAMDPCLSFQDI